ncbi:MAG: TonB-dependent receptor [Proteobacteria bacterium]|jgi:outer membrane receptor protein involved in Fe transport|nr:TonB-dependent receptor [Pseudomonadota bacterium]
MKYLLLSLLLFCGLSLAQTDVTVSGSVADSQTGLSLNNATITVFSVDSDLIATAAVTDESGRFILTGLASGNYSLSYTAPGYEKSTNALLVGTKNTIYDLGQIALMRIDGDLEELVVVGQSDRLEASLNNRIYNLSDNVAQSGGSLLDAMKTLPGVTVEQDGKVMLRGSDRVVILIDGKPSAITGYGNQTGLDSIPSANAESIEIINNPSSRYDAAGMAGIINITYKKENQEGFTGDFGLSVGAGALSKPREDLPTDLGSFSINPKVQPSVNLNYNTDKARYFLQAEVLLQDRLPNNEFTTRFYDDGRVIESQVPENREQVHYVIKTGADWLVNDNHSFFLSALFDYESHEDNAQVPFIDQASGTRNRFWFWREEEVTGYANLSFSHKYSFIEPGHELDSSIQFTRGWEDESYFLNEESPVRIGTDATHLDATEYTIPVQVDYTRPLASGRLETGLKYQKRWIPVTYLVDRGVQSVIYEGLGDFSDWNEDIYAGYANYVFERPTFDVEAGIRLEQTDVAYEFSAQNIYYDENDAYDYFEIYPNVRFTWKLNGENSLAVYMNRRVDRPGEPELRIFAKYDDPELLKVGNPYLRPQFTNNYEVAFQHLWGSGSVIASLYYRDISNAFTRIFAQDVSNPNYDIVNRIYQNTGDAQHTGLEILFTQDISDTWRLSGSFNWYNIQIDEHDVTILFPFQRDLTIAASDDDTWEIKVSNEFQLPWEVEAQVSFIYYADRAIDQGTQEARSSLDLGFKKPVFDNRGEINFSFSDVLNDFGLKQNINSTGFDAIYENYYETQVVNIGLKYWF